MGRDRTVGIVLFGCVELLLGGLALLVLPLLFTAPGVPAATAIASAGVQAIIGVFFVANGVGTILLRRWARTLTLLAARLWLAVGVLVAGLTLVVVLPLDALPGAESARLPAEGLAMVKGVLLVVVAVVYVALPAAFVLFFRSPSVVETVERANPAVPWTDRVPPPVLTFSLTLAFCAATWLTLLASPAPIFGRLVAGAGAAVAHFLSAAILGGLAWTAYARRPAAWWGSVAFFGLWTVSSGVTFWRVAPLEAYEAAGLPAEQIELLASAGLASRAWLVAGTALTGLLCGVYLLRIRPHYARGGKPRDSEVPRPREID